MAKRPALGQARKRAPCAVKNRRKAADHGIDERPARPSKRALITTRRTALGDSSVRPPRYEPFGSPICVAVATGPPIHGTCSSFHLTASRTETMRRRLAYLRTAVAPTAADEARVGRDCRELQTYFLVARQDAVAHGEYLELIDGRARALDLSVGREDAVVERLAVEIAGGRGDDGSDRAGVPVNHIDAVLEGPRAESRRGVVERDRYSRLAAARAEDRIPA